MSASIALKKEESIKSAQAREDYISINRKGVLGKLKRLIVGRALRSEQAVHERLSKKVALAVFSSDALSSTAYATEEILLVLATAAAFGQGNAFAYVIPVSIAIAVLLGIVTVSYRQTIHAYPTGGGAYIVAKENLGTVPGLTAAAALLVDYVLTVSVSISAGVAAITSAAQGTSFAWISEHRVAICLAFIILIAVANLRGVRESGALFAFPTYAFLVSFLFMIGYGLIYYFVYDGVVAAPAAESVKLAEGYAPQALTVFLLLGAFSNGCSALTGVEAISNGVQAFKKPESRNASQTLLAMALLLGIMFLGTGVLAYLFGVHPHEDETVISQFARHIFTGGMGWFYFVVQAATAAILILAANTAFADFPRLSSLLARDRFLPRQFANRGDKLVFSNGIVILGLLASVLVVAFAGDTSRLIPLYAVGVFLSFTLSQAGMVRHWIKVRRFEHYDESIHESQVESDRAIPDAHLAIEQSRVPRFVTDEVTERVHWKKSLVINLIGAVATAIVLTVFVLTKFMHGAWLVVVMIPALVTLFLAIHKHYVSVATQLSMEAIGDRIEPIIHTVIVPISGIHRGVMGALRYAKSIAPNNVTAVYVDFDEDATAKLKERWERLNLGIKLVVLPSPYRELTRPLLRFIYKVERQRDDDVVTVVLPEFVPRKWWQHLLHNQSSLLLKGALLFKEGIIVTNVPYHLQK
ncbi:MAG TPA: APC family permease [Pyrinomonadaceae bacterium]|nr:APC family permease [Pyrinomonadaceae bacterium]